MVQTLLVYLMKMEREVVLENIFGKMVRFILENLLMIVLMDMDK